MLPHQTDRAPSGIALSRLPATAMAYIGAGIDAGSPCLAMGRYTGGTGLGALAGRLVVGGFADLGPWRLGRLVVGLMALASSVAFPAALAPSRRFSPRPPSPGALLAGFARRLRGPTQPMLYGEALLLFSAIGPVGIASVGDLAGRVGRGRAFPALVALTAAGTALTLSDSVAVILSGMALSTALGLSALLARRAP